ncbi:Myc-type, basic helix-loop-helix (bHLH) domain-containing protein [Cynara cardunculus var. scolymus]|uniref:Myc-type, basic helix-loop-helix (BHLH) domain-containing protein n=1 Tax=Cynara cardunculus var. scolymus TaxID=59895 RepID=A0A124SE23_CYNCS|nr:Myc-type, basic helix-loop-helix (bHLH) domain-containing protein [Cynara cardunculus var. scolymus]
MQAIVDIFNDKFSMLQDIIPHGDQKKDKASFLLLNTSVSTRLQEKVHKYEDSYQGWSSEPPKTIPWTCITATTAVDTRLWAMGNTEP